MSSISRSIGVVAEARSVLDVVLDVESYPRWQRQVVGVDVVARDDRARPATVTMHIKAVGKRGFYTVRYGYPSDSVVQYRLVDGDMMTRNDATFSVVAGAGSGCELTVAMDLALVWPLPEVMVNQLIRKGVTDALTAIKNRAERR